MVFFRLLGPVEVVRDSRPVELGAPKQRAVLAVLLLQPGRVVSVDQIVEAVWGDDHPPSVSASLQVYISNLRRLLRDDEHAVSPIVRQAPGYRIDATTDQIDLACFVRDSEAAQTAVTAGDWAGAVNAGERALGWWRGPLLADYADEDWVRLAARASEERRDACELDLVTGLLGTGRVTPAVNRSRQAHAAQPFGERACWLHLVSLYRAGRTTEALEAYQTYARRLSEDLGLDPGPALRDLQGAILRQDTDLSVWPGPARSGPTLAGATPGVVEPAPAPRPEPPSATTGGGRTELVGRARELAAARSALAEARTDGTRWVVLGGPAGIGKTRLAAELATDWAGQGGRVVRTSCPDDEGVPPWWPVRQLLRELGADADEVLTPPPGVDADAARFVAYERVLTVLDETTRDTRLLLLVDDAHWADPVSLRFLTHLAETRSRPGLLVLLTVRDATGGAGVTRLLAAVARCAGTRQLAVPPLSTAEVQTLAAAISGEAFRRDEADRLTDRTAGNPFFVCEYARLPAEERNTGDVPIAVRSVLDRRLSGLDPAVLDVLRTAALIGDRLDLELLTAVTRLDADELADLLDEAADEHIITAPAGAGTYGFVHALLRDEVIAAISPLRRQRLHLRIAAAIGPGGGVDRLGRRAAHLLAALPLADAAEVFAACRAAAEDAEAHWQSDEAARWWDSALQVQPLLPVDTTDRVELVIAQVFALARAGRGQTLLDTVDAALLEAVRSGRTDSAGRLASTLLRAAGCWPWAAYGEDPGPLLSRLAGLESFVRDDPPAHARILATLAVGSCYDPDSAVPDQLSQRAIEVAESTGDPDILADALLGRALTYSGVGIRAAESRQLLDRLADLPHRWARVDEVLRHSLLSMAEFCLGRVDVAAEHVRLGALGSDLLRLPVSRAQLRWAEGMISQWRAEDLTATQALYDQAVQIHEQTELYLAGVIRMSDDGMRSEASTLTLWWDLGRFADADALGAENPELNAWASAVAAAARQDPGAADLVRAEIARADPPTWTSHARATLMAHAVADLELIDQVDVMRRRLEPLAGCLANMGQIGVVGPVDLALSRICAIAGDLPAARAHLASAAAVSRSARGAGAMLRCRLAEQQLRHRFGEPVDRVELEAVRTEAERRRMAGVARDAARALALPGT